MSILELPLDDFLAMLPELEQQGVDTDNLVRMYREANSPIASVNRAAQSAQDEIAAEGRRPILGGFASKPVGSTFMDAIRGIEFEGVSGALGALSGAGRAVEAPAAAARGLIPQEDMALEALGTAGMASMGGAAMTRPRGSVGMGGRVAGEALPEPRNAAERMARDILDMRAQGRASEVTDDMMAQADPQYMFNNTPLPMDEASRMARAGEAGFDTGQRYYHGSAAEDQIDRFDMAYAGSASQQPDERAIFTTQNPDVASFFANYAHPDGERMPFGGAGEGQVLPVTSRGVMKSTDFRGQPYRPEWMVQRLNSARGSGADRLSVSGMRENLDGFDPIDNQMAVFNPRNIRSRFARFDPEFAHLSNLSAANASPLAGIAGLTAEDQAIIADMDDPQEIENYIARARARGGFADGYNMTTDIRQLYSGR